MSEVPRALKEVRKRKIENLERQLRELRNELERIEM
mgnify:CR=1 FL=1